MLPSSSIVHDDAGTIFIPVWSQLKFNYAIEIGLLHTKQICSSDTLVLAFVDPRRFTKSFIASVTQPTFC